MPATANELFRKFDDLGITYKTYTHEPLFTVEDAQKVAHEMPGGHCKNLFLKDKNGDLYLLVCLQETKVDLKAFRKQVGAKNLSFGKPDLLMEVLGVEPGSVTPFSLINDTERRVKVVLEERMVEMEMLNYHPLTNCMTTQISSEHLSLFIKDRGYEPLVLDLNVSS
jgi:Ala-tRNA(Pro) deacylase